MSPVQYTRPLVAPLLQFRPTEVSPTDRKYSIWHREQLLVLLSRVPNLNNITFVGSKDDAMQTIKLTVR